MSTSIGYCNIYFNSDRIKDELSTLSAKDGFIALSTIQKIENVISNAIFIIALAFLGLGMYTTNFVYYSIYLGTYLLSFITDNSFKAKNVDFQKVINQTQRRELISILQRKVEPIQKGLFELKQKISSDARLLA
jgi:hypothetical protein